MNMTKVTLYFINVVGSRSFIVDTYPSGSLEAIKAVLDKAVKDHKIMSYETEPYFPAMSVEEFLKKIHLGL